MGKNTGANANAQNNGQQPTYKTPPKGERGQGRKKSIHPNPGETLEGLILRIDTWLKRRVDGKTIAGRLGVHYDTFDSWGQEIGLWGPNSEDGVSDFSAYKALKRAEGAESIVESQFVEAQGQYDPGEIDPKTRMWVREPMWIRKPNAVMQIWLGKQYANQSDKTDVTSGGEKMDTVPKQVVVKIQRRPKNDH